MRASSERISSFLWKQERSVEAMMWEMVPKRWKSMATNWMRMMAKKKNTSMIPIGSRCRYSLVMMTCGWNDT